MVRAVFISGGSGFIGTQVRRALASQGVRVVNFDLVVPPSSFSTESYVSGDIRDPKKLAEVIREAGPFDAAIHLAAIVSVPECEKDPEGSWVTNVLGTKNLVDSLRRDTQIRLSFASSAAIYGHQGRAAVPLSERVSPDPLSHYARQKLEAEGIISESGLPWTILRLFNVFGPGQVASSPYSGVISRFVHALSNGQGLTLFGEGHQTRDFVSVHDVARAFAAVALSEGGGAVSGTYNVGTGHAVTIRELANLLQDLDGKRIPTLRASPRAGDVEHSCADIERICNDLNWRPEIDLKSGLAELLR